MKAIRFLRHSGSYNAGEVATFSDARAQRYVQRGLATYFGDEPPEQPDAPAQPEPASRVPTKIKTR